jgi:chaperone LolA
MDSGKYSRRLRRKTELKVLLLGTLAISALARGQANDTLDAFLEQVQSLSAEFTQELWSADQELIEASEGTLELARPNRFVWHYRKPTEQRIVADGTRLWMYDVDLEQVTVTALDELDQANPAMLLGGDREVRDSFDIVETFALDGRDWVRLAPKGGGTEFASIAIAFREGRPEELEFVDGLDQTTRIEFSDLEINPALDASTFVFEPPAGVDVFGDED